MQARVLHTVLAFLILLQSLTAAAMVPAGPVPAHVDDMQGPMTHCHDTVESLAPTLASVEQATDCCDGMNGGSCYLNCASMLVTVSPSYWSGSTRFHQVQIPGQAYTSHPSSLSEFFRPPRIS
jgi:hypothetical protein